MLRRQSAIVVAMAAGMLIPAARATAQEPGQPTGRRVAAVVAEIRDRAGIFGADAIAEARRELERVSRKTGLSIIIETIDSLDGRPAERVALDLARRSGIHGIFMLIAQKEHKIEVMGSAEARDVVSDAHRRKIVAAFAEGFSRRDYNEGLKRGVAAIVAMLEEVHPGLPGGGTATGRPPVPEGRSVLSTGEAAPGVRPARYGRLAARRAEPGPAHARRRPRDRRRGRGQGPIDGLEDEHRRG